MKAVKIILGIVIGLTVAFLAIGLVVKEVKYSAEVKVGKPVTDVFELFNDETKIANWIPEITEIKVIEKKPAITGSTYQIKLITNKQEIIMEQRVLAHVPNKKVTLFFDAESMLKTDEYIFIHNGDETIITLNSICKSENFFLACMFPFFKSKFREQDQQYLNNFKNFAEN